MHTDDRRRAILAAVRNGKALCREHGAFAVYEWHDGTVGWLLDNQPAPDNATLIGAWWLVGKRWYRVVERVPRG